MNISAGSAAHPGGAMQPRDQDLPPPLWAHFTPLALVVVGIASLARASSVEQVFLLVYVVFGLGSAPLLVWHHLRTSPIATTTVAGLGGLGLGGFALIRGHAWPLATALFWTLIAASFAVHVAAVIRNRRGSPICGELARRYRRL